VIKLIDDGDLGQTGDLALLHVDDELNQEQDHVQILLRLADEILVFEMVVRISDVIIKVVLHGLMKIVMNEIFYFDD
jgi:hypothetical protein